jgi:hypothetical protein
MTPFPARAITGVMNAASIGTAMSRAGAFLMMISGIILSASA